MRKVIALLQEYHQFSLIEYRWFRIWGRVTAWDVHQLGAHFSINSEESGIYICLLIIELYIVLDWRDYGN